MYFNFDFFKYILGKLFSSIFYIIYLSSALYLALQIREGINLGDLVSEDSYYKHYITEAQRLTNLYPVVMMYIHEPIDYDNVQVRMKIKNLVKNAQKIDGISKTFSINWLAAFSHNKLKYKKRFLNNFSSNMNNPFTIISLSPYHLSFH